MSSTERRVRLPLLHEVLDLEEVRRRIEKLSLRQVLELLDDDDFVVHDGHIFKRYHIMDKVPVTVLATVIDCPWSIVTSVLIAQQYGEDRNVLYVPVNVHAVLYGRLVHERYLTYLEQMLDIPIEVELEAEVQTNGRTVRIVGRADALVLSNEKIVVLEVKTSSRLLLRHVAQVWAYAHMVNRYVNDRIAKPLFITPSGMSRPDRYYTWRDILHMTSTVIYAVENSGDVPWDRSRNCPRVKCPHYPWCPKAARLTG